MCKITDQFDRCVKVTEWQCVSVNIDTKQKHASDHIRIKHEKFLIICTH